MFVRHVFYSELGSKWSNVGQRPEACTLHYFIILRGVVILNLRL